MDFATQLDLDLSALPVDDFEVEEDLTIEPLTGDSATKIRSCTCNFCACPCICVV